MNGQKQLEEYVDDETREHQERTASIRFKQSIIQGIGGPMVFGLVFAACGALFNVAFGSQMAGLVAASASLTWPLVTIGALFAIGVGCIYFGSKLNSELSRLEQNYGAKQIAKGINGKTLEIDQKPVAFPSQDKNIGTALMDKADAAPEKPLADAPASTITAERSLENRVVPIAATKEQADEAKKPETYTARVAANDEPPAQPTPVRA